MTREATQEQRWDHARDLLKHEPRPSDLTVSQRFALAKLIGNCETVVGLGLLSPAGESFLRGNIAETLAAFGMPSKTERDHAQA